VRVTAAAIGPVVVHGHDEDLVIGDGGAVAAEVLDPRPLRLGALQLILDMREEKATVLWAPSADGYTARLTKPFGEKPDIPAPFDRPLGTAGFQAPADS
jgi:hypothetical protein